MGMVDEAFDLQIILYENICVTAYAERTRKSWEINNENLEAIKYTRGLMCNCILESWKKPNTHRSEYPLGLYILDGF